MQVNTHKYCIHRQFLGIWCSKNCKWGHTPGVSPFFNDGSAPSVTTFTIYKCRCKTNAFHTATNLLVAMPQLLVSPSHCNPMAIKTWKSISCLVIYAISCLLCTTTRCSSYEAHATCQVIQGQSKEHHFKIQPLGTDICLFLIHPFSIRLEFLADSHWESIVGNQMTYAAYCCTNLATDLWSIWNGSWVSRRYENCGDSPMMVTVTGLIHIEWARLTVQR